MTFPIYGKHVPNHQPDKVGTDFKRKFIEILLRWTTPKVNSFILTRKLYH